MNSQHILENAAFKLQGFSSEIPAWFPNPLGFPVARFEQRSWQLRLTELRQICRVLRELIPPYLLQAALQAVPWAAAGWGCHGGGVVEEGLGEFFGHQLDGKVKKWHSWI